MYVLVLSSSSIFKLIADSVSLCIVLQRTEKSEARIYHRNYPFRDNLCYESVL